MRSLKTIVPAIILSFLAPLSQAAELSAARKNLELTVYNQDFALVKENRDIELREGVNAVRLENIAAQIDPTSVGVKSLSLKDGLRVLEQNYQYDLVNYGKLMEKYIGKEVEVHEISDAKTGETRIKKAKLLSTGYTAQPYGSGRYQFIASSQPIYEMEGKVYTGTQGNLVLPSLPEGLILRPALDWQLESAKDGAQTVEISYMTNGIKWNADYVAVVSADDKMIDLVGWVTLDNRSGVSYENAKLKLMAGDVNLVQPQGYAMEDRATYKMAMASAAPQFQEKTFFEYHLYTLQRPATILDNEIKQVEFTRASGVPVNKKYVYDGFKSDYFSRYGGDYRSFREQRDFGADSNSKVAVMLEFKNSKENNMGMPLPRGRTRFYKQDPDGGQEFVGEDLIDHTPKDEELRFSVGNAFDLVGERKQTNYTVVEPGHMVEETFEITLRNHKEEDVSVVVREHLYRWSEWKLVGSSHDFEKKSAQLMEAVVPVPKNGEVKVSYTVHYSW